MAGQHDDDEEDYYVPLEDQRVFGAGIKRKRVAFVPESTLTDGDSVGSSAKAADIGNRYLSIVLPQAHSGSSIANSSQGAQKSDTVAQDSSTSASTLEDPSSICPICKLPLSTPVPSSGPHESSITHQASMPHSHPPSHLPRQHVGLKYLSSYGWDPDSRLGLGSTGKGIRVPIKAKEKNDTVGLGVDLGQGEDQVVRKQKRKDDGPIKKLNAKQVRKLEEQKRQNGERLRRAFYQSEEVLKYLGDNG